MATLTLADFVANDVPADGDFIFGGKSTEGVGDEQKTTWAEAEAKIAASIPAGPTGPAGQDGADSTGSDWPSRATRW